MTGPGPAATVAAMHTLRRAFVADDGRLNLVWRVVLYLLSWWVVFFLGIVPATLVANLFHWDDRGKNAAFAVFGSALLIAWTAVFRRWVDRRPWRGIGLTTPSTGLSMLAAVLFAFVVHFNKLSPVLVATAILIGMLFGLTRLATGAIWFAIGLHWAYDGAQNFFYGLSTTSPPYNHSLLHLQARGFLASSGGEDWIQVVLIIVALVGMVLWMQHTGRLSWHWRLDDEGRPRSEAD